MSNEDFNQNISKINQHDILNQTKIELDEEGQENQGKFNFCLILLDKLINTYDKKLQKDDLAQHKNPENKLSQSENCRKIPKLDYCQDQDSCKNNEEIK